MSRETSEDCQRLIGHFEGNVLHVYQDEAGIDTIGKGHRCFDLELRTGVFGPGLQAVRDAKGRWSITEEQSEELFAYDLGPRAEAVDEMTAGIEGIDDAKRSVLIDFAFNEGTEALRTSTLLVKLKQGNLGAAPSELLRWDKVKDKSGRLVVSRNILFRREAEIAVWENGFGHPVADNAIALAAKHAADLRFDLIDLARSADDDARRQQDTWPGDEPTTRDDFGKLS